MNSEQPLEVLQSLVFAQTHQHFNNLQIAILRGSWENQSYEEIAEAYSCSSTHAKIVGSELWKFLSEVLGTKVNKKNFQAVLQRKVKELAVDVVKDPIADDWDVKLLSVTSPTKSVTNISPEIPGGQIPLDSPFYIQRPFIEQRCYDTILQPGALIRIQGLRQMGKTSLMSRIVHQGRLAGYRTVSLNLQLAEKSILTSLNRFLQWLCVSVGKNLGLPNQLAEYWDDILGSNASITDYFQKYLLAELDNPIVIALDELNILYQYPDIASDFFSLLRSWYERSRYGDSTSAIWQKLRMVLVYSTEIDPVSDFNRSPFNVALSIELPEFTKEQVKELAKLWGLDWQDSQVEQLISLVGGHPYLIGKAFYHIRHEDFTLEDILPQSAKKGRIYGEYLRQKFAHLQQHPELYQAFARITRSPTPIELEREEALKLNRMGLVHLSGNQVTPRCDLYRYYFNVN